MIVSKEVAKILTEGLCEMADGADAEVVVIDKMSDGTEKEEDPRLPEGKEVA